MIGSIFLLRLSVHNCFFKVCLKIKGKFQIFVDVLHHHRIKTNDETFLNSVLFIAELHNLIHVYSNISFPALDIISKNSSAFNSSGASSLVSMVRKITASVQYGWKNDNQSSLMKWKQNGKIQSLTLILCSVSQVWVWNFSLKLHCDCTKEFKGRFITKILI